MIGQTLSHYRITSALGAGGMGEVYRATDTNLQRDVAIKVLPPEVAQDPERLGRFKREAHLLAALNHPNIAAIYGLEECDGKPFLALELVEGEDLKQRLSRGAIPVDEALEITKQIAEALEEAHNKGIVHRDLKPANVKLTPEGKVKVLDFGLAKAWAGDGSGANSGSSALSQSPTLAHTGTIAGVILGTAAYMSPEQARGRPVDKRSDVWSFGVLLWEMLTGQSLFAGETVTDVIAQVMTREPDLAALPSKTPLAVRRLLSRCLRRDPRQRLPDMGSARLDLQDAIAGTGAEEPAAATAEGPQIGSLRARLKRERVAWALVAVAAIAVAAAFVAIRPRAAGSRPESVHFTIDMPRGWSLGQLRPVPSPDGRDVAFLAVPAGGQGRPMLWIRSLRSPAVRPLPGTEGAGAGAPFWSPDSRHLAFFADGELRQASIADGTTRRICAVTAGVYFEGAWSPNGTILLTAANAALPIQSVSAAGGKPNALTPMVATDDGERNRLPEFLPDGERFLYSVIGELESAGIYMASLAEPGKLRRVAASDRGPLVHAAGHLLWFEDGTVFAQRADDPGAPTGSPAGIASPVSSGALGSGVFRVSPQTLAYVSGLDGFTRSQLTWLDRKGHALGTLGAPAQYGQLAMAPDGSRVAVEIVDQNRDLWVMDVERGLPTRVTATPDHELDPVWSPDSTSLAWCVYSAATSQRRGLRRKSLAGGEPEEVVSEEKACPESWLPDGSLLGTRQADVATAFAASAWSRSADGSGNVPGLPAGRVDELQVSPDGRWLAFVSWESGRAEVYIQPFGRGGERLRVSAEGGGQPRWSGDGRELFFTVPPDRLAVVTVHASSDRVSLGAPTVLFAREGQFPRPVADEYAPSADGQRFLVKLLVDAAQKPQLHVVTNWTSLLSKEGDTR